MVGRALRMLREAESHPVERRAKGSPGLPIQPNRAFGRLPARQDREGCSEMACSCKEKYRFGAVAQKGGWGSGVLGLQRL